MVYASCCQCGSVLGSFLFNVGIDSIESGCVYPEEQFVDNMESHGSRTDYPAASTPARGGRSMPESMESPIQVNLSTDQEFRILPTATNTPLWLRCPKEQIWRKRQPMDLKFIEDGVNVSAINLKKVATYIGPDGDTIKCVHPVKAQAMLHHITCLMCGLMCGLLPQDEHGDNGHKQQHHQKCQKSQVPGRHTGRRLLHVLPH